jgi:hypothetical protein
MKAHPNTSRIIPQNARSWKGRRQPTRHTLRTGVTPCPTGLQQWSEPVLSPVEGPVLSPVEGPVLRPLTDSWVGDALHWGYGSLSAQNKFQGSSPSLPEKRASRSCERYSSVKVQRLDGQTHPFEGMIPRTSKSRNSLAGIEWILPLDHWGLPRHTPNKLRTPVTLRNPKEPTAKGVRRRPSHRFAPPALPLPPHDPARNLVAKDDRVEIGLDLGLHPHGSLRWEWAAPA